MTGIITAAALAIAAALSCVVAVARQVETTIPVVTSLIKKLIDARLEIADHLAGRSRAAKVDDVPKILQQVTSVDETDLSSRHQRAA